MTGEVHTVTTVLTKGDIRGAVVAQLVRPAVLLKSWASWTPGMALFIGMSRGMPHDSNEALVLAI